MLSIMGQLWHVYCGNRVIAYCYVYKNYVPTCLSGLSANHPLYHKLRDLALNHINDNLDNMSLEKVLLLEH